MVNSAICSLLKHTASLVPSPLGVKALGMVKSGAPQTTGVQRTVTLAVREHPPEVAVTVYTVTLSVGVAKASAASGLSRVAAGLHR